MAGLDIQGDPQLCIEFEPPLTKEILDLERRKSDGGGESKKRRGGRREKGRKKGWKPSAPLAPSPPTRTTHYHGHTCVGLPLFWFSILFLSKKLER